MNVIQQLMDIDWQNNSGQMEGAKAGRLSDKSVVQALLGHPTVLTFLSCPPTRPLSATLGELTLHLLGHSLWPHILYFLCQIGYI